MHKLFGPFPTGRVAAGLLVARLIFGLGIALHGYQKYTAGVFSWFGPGGIPAPLQGLATCTEFFGGVGIMLGLLTPLSALAVLGTMTVAMLKVHLPAGSPYVSLTNGPSYELAGHYLAYVVALLLTGPGAWSLDYLAFGRLLRRNAYAP